MLCLYLIFKTDYLGGLFAMPFISWLSSTYLFQTFSSSNFFIYTYKNVFNIIYVVTSIPDFFKSLCEKSRFFYIKIHNLNFDTCEINDNSYYLQFHCHFNHFFMKRHFSTFFGHFLKYKEIVNLLIT